MGYGRHLIDSEPIWDIAVEDFAERNGLALSPELREATLGNSLPDAMSKVYDAAGIAVDDRDTDADARWLLDHVGGLFEEGCRGGRGREALDAVGDAGIAMVLVTNTVRELAEVALATIDRARFSATVCGDEVPMGKPAPFPSACRRSPRLWAVCVPGGRGFADGGCLGERCGLSRAHRAVRGRRFGGTGAGVPESLVGVGVGELSEAFHEALALQ